MFVSLLYLKVSKQLFGSASTLMPAQFQFYNQLQTHASLNDQSSGKRILIFGLPRSGAGLFSFLLAQRPAAVAVPRMYQGASVPRSDDLKLGSAPLSSSSSNSDKSSSGNSISSVGKSHERHSKGEKRRALTPLSTPAEVVPEAEKVTRGPQKGSAMAVSSALKRAVDPVNGQLKALAFDAIDLVMCVPLFQDNLFHKDMSTITPTKTTMSSGANGGTALRRNLLGFNGTNRVESGLKRDGSVGGSAVRVGATHNGTKVYNVGQGNEGKGSSSVSGSSKGCKQGSSSGLCAHVASVRAAIAAFQPDVSFLVLRHPARHHGSLYPQVTNDNFACISSLGF